MHVIDGGWETLWEPMHLRMRCEYKRRAPCSLLELHQLHLIMIGHLNHVIDVPMNFVGGLIEDYKSAVVSVVCVLAPVVTPWLINVHLYLASTSGPPRSIR